MFRSTTIICINHKDKVAIGGDGQVSLENTIVKSNACKIRTLRDGSVLAGFAGSAADSFTLFERFEGKLEEFKGNLPRAAVELAKEWRTDKVLRRLEAMMIIADKKCIFTLSGAGDVIEPDDNIAAIGSGGGYALSAARALIKHSSLNAPEIVKESLKIASEICLYTNSNIKVEELK